jgi:hypothetical protein
MKMNIQIFSIITTLFITVFGAHLNGQTEYAVMVREPGTKKTYYGDGGIGKGSHRYRSFCVCQIDFSDSFQRSLAVCGVLGAKKNGSRHVFSPVSDRNPLYSGTSYLLDIGKGNFMEMLALSASDPEETAWYFPQGKASNVQLVSGGSYRKMATRLTSPFGFGVYPYGQMAMNATAITFTLDADLSRRLNAQNPGNVQDAGDKLIAILEGLGWLNLGYDQLY